jgi:hypothetical protein
MQYMLVVSRLNIMLYNKYTMIRWSTGCPRIPSGAEERNEENSMERTPTAESIGKTQNTDRNRSRETPRIHKASSSGSERMSPEVEEKPRRRRTQDNGLDQSCHKIERNCCLEVQDGLNSQWSGRTG